MGLRSVVGALLAKFAMGVLKREAYRGFEVISLSPSGERDALIRRLDEGLDLIQHFDPRRYHALPRYLKRFIMVPGGGDHFSAALQAHMVDASRLKTRTNTLTALSIVHEATHARLHRCGIVMKQANAERIEELCVGQQIAFAQRLPGGDDIARQLAGTLQQQWWTETKTLERIQARLELAGWPKWLIWFILLPERLRGKYPERQSPSTRRHQ